MKKCVRRYLDGGYAASKDRLCVLDIGGANVNGSYSDLFPASKYDYSGADLEHGEGVDVVLEDPYKFPLKDASVDIVISGQTFEHNEFFWLTFTEMVRVVKDDGYIFLIAPSAGPIHRYPVDCYRFYPDAYRALAKYTGCKVLDIWRDERGHWHDLVGIFNKSGEHNYPPGPPDLRSAFEANSPGGFAEVPSLEVTQGEVPTRDVLRRIHNVLRPIHYLEIGVRRGRSLALASCDAVGVDPLPEVTVRLSDNARVVQQTSDDFFDDASDPILQQQPDLVLIDGMHLVENALRDFMNVERFAGAGTVVMIDDVLPNVPAQAERNRRTTVWAGDVWKLHRILQAERPDLVMVLLDTFPTGLLMITGLNPKNRRLWERYNKVAVQAIFDEVEPGQEQLERKSAVSPNSVDFSNFLVAVAKTRTENRPLAKERSRLLSILAGR